MKSTITAVGMLAAVASAYSPVRHLHFPRGNGTENLTTLTVKTTQIHTVTSCAPTITNCPADATGIANLPEDQKTTMVVTDTVVLTKTVCPVSDVPKISSSIIAKASTGGITGTTLAPTTVTQPIHPTAPSNASSADPVTQPSMTTKVTSVVTSKTVTMTLGRGTSASAVVTVVPVTVQKTVTVPCSQATADATSQDQTTTTTATTRITRTVTVQRSHPTTTAGANSPIGGNGGNGGNTGNGGNGGSGSKGECECAASTVTVTAAQETVTVPASTVYVTIGGAGVTGADDKPSPTQTGGNKPVTTNKAEPTFDCDDETTTLQHTVTVVPYPSGNGTNTSGSAKPSGFARLRR